MLEIFSIKTRNQYLRRKREAVQYESAPSHARSKSRE